MVDMTSWRLFPLIGVTLVIACAPKNPRPGGSAVDGVSCESLEDCREHPRECRIDLIPACKTCSGLTQHCRSRSPGEVSDLDRQRLECESEGNQFSYTRGCLCENKPCLGSKEQCEKSGGVYSDLGCITGELKKPERHDR